MSTKHTPGPWKFGSKADKEHYARNIAGQDGYHVASVSSRNDQEIDANARLIAASPELLEALQGMVALAEEMNDASDEGGQLDARFDAARAAIAKATGEKT